MEFFGDGSGTKPAMHARPVVADLLGQRTITLHHR
jgi:hypothetical protein